MYMLFFLLFLLHKEVNPVVSSAISARGLIVNTPVVDLGYAQYEGLLDTTSNVTVFLGIQYAANPTGTLRWEAPVTPDLTALGIQPATSQPPQCFQGPTGSAPTNPFAGVGVARRSAEVTSSEDCLFLNVYTPGSLPTTEKLPVLVWIHGGGYLAGSASGFDGRDLIRESSAGLVVVIIQYRLGLFGFLPGTKVKEGGVLNAGLLDQHFALRWVHEHITKFGGDPAKVTIWGESAGAGSVLQHIVAQDGKTNPPLFRAAMTSSTFLPSQCQYNDTVPETLYSEVIAQTNCSASNDTLACLRATDVDVLQQANTNINAAGFFGTFVFVPVVDGTFITQRPILALQQKKINGEILLAVTNTFEGTVFVNQSTTFNITQYAAQLFPEFSSPRISDLIANAYGNLGTSLFQADALMGESIFICPTYYLLEAFSGTSFKGEFAIPPGTHGNDVAYYFPTTSAPSFANADFLNAFSQSFTAVAKSLSPNAKFDPTNITPHWPRWSHGETEMLFNKTDANEPVVQTISTSSDLLERCRILNSLGAFSAQ